MQGIKKPAENSRLSLSIFSLLMAYNATLGIMRPLIIISACIEVILSYSAVIIQSFYCIFAHIEI
jgi:hypothetical protein